MNALISNHDGIAGTWQPVDKDDVLADKQENSCYLARLSPAVRAAIFAFEIGSRIGFRFDKDDEMAQVFHLETQFDPGDPADASNNPKLLTNYQTLMEMKRPTQKIFSEQLTLVANYANLRQDRASEVIAQLSTPLEFLRAIAFVEPDRTPHTVELLGMALWLANDVEMRLKYSLACKRPIEWSPQIQPMIWTPTHGSLPSGHATESFCMAQVLWSLLRAAGTKPYSEELWGVMMMRQAARIAINRTVAGVHFPVDSSAGAVLGLNLAEYFVKRCKKDQITKGWGFDGTKYTDTGIPAGSAANLDFDWRDYYIFGDTNPGLGLKDGVHWVSETAFVDSLDDMPSEPLNWLWKRAKAEWKAIGSCDCACGCDGSCGCEGGQQGGGS